MTTKTASTRCRGGSSSTAVAKNSGYAKTHMEALHEKLRKNKLNRELPDCDSAHDTGSSGEEDVFKSAAAKKKVKVLTPQLRAVVRTGLRSEEDGDEFKAVANGAIEESLLPSLFRPPSRRNCPPLCCPNQLTQLLWNGRVPGCWTRTWQNQRRRLIGRACRRSSMAPPALTKPPSSRPSSASRPRSQISRQRSSRRCSRNLHSS